MMYSTIVSVDLGFLEEQPLEVHYIKFGHNVVVTHVYFNNHDYLSEISDAKISELAAIIYSEEPDGCSLDKARAEAENG